jgi:GTPase SAR1 family protein
MGATYLRGASGALIVCDLTRLDTLAAWVFYAKQMRAINPNALLVFVANKADLEDERQIEEADLIASSEALGGSYLLTSAKTGDGVEDAFNLFTGLIETQG